MSNRLDLDLDTALPANGTDLPAGEWDDDLMEDFPEGDPAAFDDRSSDSLRSAEAPGSMGSTGKAEAARSKKTGRKKKQPRERKPGRRANAGRAGPGAGGATTAWSWLSLFVGLLVVLGSLMFAAGVLIATGNAPRDMLDFSGLRDLSTLGDLENHPVNAFWVSTVLVVLVGILAASGIHRRLRDLREMLDDRDDLLAAVAALDPDVPDSWRQEILLSDVELSAVTGNLLGHYHLQQAKLARYVGLEGELHRLEKAIAEDSPVELKSSWDNPCAGSLADQALRLIEDRNGQARQAAMQQESLESHGEDLLSVLREARIWQKKSLDQVNHQGVVVEQINRQLGKVGAKIKQDKDIAPRQERLVQALSAIRDELAALAVPGGADSETADTSWMTELSERAGRLAFQIAMEVARLGPKGERLLPLTQELEELTTELRGRIEGIKAQATDAHLHFQFTESVRGRLADLDPQIVRGGDGAHIAKALDGVGQLIDKSSAELVDLSRHFADQAARLGHLNQLAASLTGTEVDESDDLSSPDSEGGIQVDRFDPFASSGQAPGTLVADPFASSGVSIFDSAQQGDRDFAHQILPGEEDSLLETPGSGPSIADRASPEEAPAPDDEATLSPADEKIYDLTEFGAELLPRDSMLEELEPKVYDLEEFGAVRIA